MKVLVLSGGGARGAYQLGCLDTLIAQGETWDAIVGTSVGSLNAAGLALLNLSSLKDVWFGIKGDSDILGTHWLSLLWSNGIYTTRPLLKLLKRVLPNNTAPKLPTYFAVCNMEDGQVYYERASADKNRNVDAVLASASMPVAMEPVGAMVDGGVREIIPLSFAIKTLNADKITVISCGPLKKVDGSWSTVVEPWKPSFPKIASYLLRTIDIMSSEIMANDLRVCEMRNEIEGFKRVDVTVYAPSGPVINTLDFDPKKIKEAFAVGQKMAELPKVAFS